MFLSITAITGRRLPDATGRRPVEFENCAGPKDHSTNVQKQVRAVCTISAVMERPPSGHFYFYGGQPAGCGHRKNCPASGPSAALGIKKSRPTPAVPLKTEKDSLL